MSLDPADVNSDAASPLETPAGPPITAASPMHIAALEWAARGVAVFPCKPGQKAPATEHGEHDATTNVDQIDEWWRADPSYNPAIVPASAGLTVIDRDVHPETGEKIGAANWWALQDQHGDAPPTYEQETPSGGRHSIFAGAIPNSTGGLADFVDVKSRTGYILVAPSVIDGRDRKGAKHPLKQGAYKVASNAWPPAPLPEGVRALATAVSERKPAVRRGEATCLDNLATALQHVAVDRYDAWRDILFACKSANVADGEEAVWEVFDGWAQTQPGYDEAENRQIWEAASGDGGIGVGTLYGAARDGGYTGPTGPTTVLERFADALAELPNTAADAPAAATDEDLERLRLLFPSYGPLAGATRPLLTFWDDGRLLPMPGSSGRLGLLVAPSHAGKTTAEICLAVTAALERGARVLFCCGEGGDDVMAQQLPAALDRRGVTLADFDARRLWLTVDAVPLLSEPSQVAGFIQLYRAFKPDLVIFDTLATALAGLDENTALAAAQLTGNGGAGKIARSFKATVVFAHHTGKVEERGGRGSSGFHGNPDFILRLTADRAARVSSIFVDKMRGGRRGYSQDFAVEPGRNEVGVAMPIDPKEAGRRKGRVNPADRAREEVAHALFELAEGVNGKGGTVKAADLAAHIQGMRQEARRLAAEADDMPYSEPTPEEVTVERASIHKHTLLRFSKPGAKDGKPVPAVLAGFVALDIGGAPLEPLQFKVART